MGAADGHLGVDAAGHLVFAAGGHLAFDCGANLCDPDPDMDVTLTWTDSDTTKSYLGKTFTNGETKVVCPTLYVCAYYQFYSSLYSSPTVGLFSNYWIHNSGATNQLALYVRNTRNSPTAPYIYRNKAQAKGLGGGLRAYYRYYVGSSPKTISPTTTTALSTYGVHGSTLNFRGPASIQPQMFSQMTTTSGITIKWAKGAGNWTCP